MRAAELDVEMKGIFDRADELLRDLVHEYEACAQVGQVSERARNLFHEVLVKLRSALDFVMYRIYEKHSTLHNKKKMKMERRASFPIFNKKDKFDKKLRRLGLSSLETDNPSLHRKLLKAQPFATCSQDLLILRDLSNLGKHAKLARQNCSRQRATKISRPNGVTTVFTKGSGFFDKDGKPVDPGPECDVENIIFATFSVYKESRHVTMPELFCQSLCQGTRRYVESVLPLI